MTFPAFWNEAWTAALVNHLWQSTVVVMIVWLLTLSLRDHQARTRYRLWMITSVKFLVPFSLFIAAGEALRSAVAIPVVRPVLAALMEQPSRVWSRAQLLERARGTDLSAYERNIDGHVKNLRQKLKAHFPEASPIRSVYGVGYGLEKI